MIFQDKQAISLRQTLAGLKNRGYQLRFRREATCIYSFELDMKLIFCRHFASIVET